MRTVCGFVGGQLEAFPRSTSTKGIAPALQASGGSLWLVLSMDDVSTMMTSSTHLFGYVYLLSDIHEQLEGVQSRSYMPVRTICLTLKGVCGCSLAPLRGASGDDGSRRIWIGLAEWDGLEWKST